MTPILPSFSQISEGFSAFTREVERTPARLERAMGASFDIIAGVPVGLAVRGDSVERLRALEMAGVIGEPSYVRSYVIVRQLQEMPSLPKGFLAGFSNSSLHSKVIPVLSLERGARMCLAPASLDCSITSHPDCRE